MANQATHTGSQSASADESGHWYKVNDDETAVSTPRTVQALHNEHIYMFNLLDSLDEQVGLIARGEDADFNLLLDIVDYMRNFPEQFHHPKEDIIYQRMALRDDGVAHDVVRLLDEHRVLHKLIEGLAEAIRDIHVMPTVLKIERAAQLCAEYEARMRQHINTEEGKILPRALEVLRAEDWFLIDQNSTPINEIPIDNLLTDNYTALRRFFKGNTEKLANNLVLAEFLGNHSLLEFCGGLGENLGYGSKAYKQGVRQGWDAYWDACKSWMPNQGSSEPRFRNPLQSSWNAFLSGMADVDKPETELLRPLQRALKLYTALVGGRGRSLLRKPEADHSGLEPNGMLIMEDMGKLLQ